MSGTRIDYSDLHVMVDRGVEDTERKKERRSRLRGLPLRLVKWAVGGVVLLTLPFFALVRVGVFAYQQYQLATWPALGAGVAATALLLLVYAWAVGRKLGAGKGVRKLLSRGAVGVCIAYTAYALLYVASSNVKTEELRSEYSALHPLLRVASSTITLVDRDAVITDLSRTAEDYFLMGLSVNEASLHFRQPDGFVHALDLRTIGRAEWKNRAVELYYWAMGFHSRRHVGTADHLHVSLRMP